jgi:hypothetical protein
MADRLLLNHDETRISKTPNGSQNWRLHAPRGPMSDQPTDRARRPSARQPRHRPQRLRTVTFSSLRARVIWAAIGIAALVAGYLLAAPSFQPAPNPPEPWGLWIATNGTSMGPYLGKLIELKLDGSQNCNAPVNVTGNLQWTRSLSAHGKLVPLRAPTTLVLGISEARVLTGEMSVEGAEGWHPMHVARFHNVYILEGRAPRWNKEHSTVKLHLMVDASRSAGYGACYITSPALLEYEGPEPAFEVASQAAVYVQSNKALAHTKVHEWLPTDAIVWLNVAHREPDRAALDAHGQVRRGNVLVTCTEADEAPKGQAARDPYYYWRSLVGESSCASVQTFRATDTTETLELRVFLAGILVSAGIGILLEALVTGRVETRSTDRRASSR